MQHRRPARPGTRSMAALARMRWLAGPLALVLGACGSGTGTFLVTTPPTDLVYADPAPVYTACVAVTPNAPSFTGVIDQWSVAPPLPPGLSLNPNTGVISGAASAAAVPTVHTVTGFGPVGSTEAEISIEVLTPAPPANLTYAAPAPTYTSGVAIAPNGPILDGVASSFAVDPSLPAGLVLDPITGVLSGTPEAESPAATYRITASNCLGASTEFDLTLTVLQGGPGLGDVPRFLFVANGGDATISRLVIDADTGLTRHVGHVPAPAGPRDLVLAPDGTHLFCLSGDTPSVAVFEVSGADGHLTPIVGSPFALPGGSDPRQLALTADGTRLYVSLAALDQVVAFSVGAGGALSPVAGSPVAVPGTGAGAQGPHGLLLSPGGDRLFVSLEGAGAVTSLALLGSGLPSATGAGLVTVGTGPRDLVAVAGNAGQLYVVVANTGGGSLQSLAVGAGGSLTSVAVGPFGAGSSPDALVAANFGGSRIVYACLGGFGIVTRVLVSGATGQLSTPGQATGGPQPVGLAISADRSTAFVVYAGASELSGGSLDGSGAFTAATLGGLPVDRVRLRPGARALAILGGAAAAESEDTALYSANFDSGEVSQFAFDGSTDQLTSLAPPSVDGGANPNWVAVHPRLARLYAADFQDPGGADLRVYPIGTGGALGAPALLEIGDASADNGDVHAVLVDPAGRNLYAIRTGSPGEVVHYSLSAAGDPTAVGATSLGGSARGGAIDPTGQFLWVANNVAGELRGFRVDGASGALTPLSPPTVAAGFSPFAVAFDPTGRFVFAANRSSGTVSAYQVDAASGALTLLTEVDLDTGGVPPNPADLVVERFGRLVYVADEGQGNLHRLALNLNPQDVTPDGTPILLGPPTATGGTVRGLAIDGSGTRLFAGVQSTGEVRLYGLDAGAGGVLTLLQQAAAGPGSRSLALRRRVQ
ncbi:MAG: beta-propeller fold lactonase family protein [Planctomycetaceae bacterium]|nr:beta-propeller fold lactonase family protein [Planctomycetaceae bacterium]